MKKSPLVLLSIIITVLEFQIRQSNSQQTYVNNNQLSGSNSNTTHGFQCNGNRSSCSAYVTYRSQPPSYSTPPNIAFLLNSNTSTISRLNNISELDPIPADRLVVIPVTCSCRNSSNSSYYQHNARYRLQNLGETYFSIANNTYQGLTTWQAMAAQNNINITNLIIGDELLVPLMCACPTNQQQRQYRSQYLLSYITTWGDDVSQIAEMFGVDYQSVLDANELRENDTIFPFTPILVPLTSPFTHINLPSPPPTPSPQAETPDMPDTGGGSSNKGVFIGIGIGVGVLVLVIGSFLVWFFVLRPSRKKPVSTSKSEGKGRKVSESSSLFTPLPVSYTSSQTSTKSSSIGLDGLKLAIGSLTAYKFKEIEKATGSFGEGNKIKGSMYRGEFNGDEAAIKILKGNVPNDEINILKHINHSNITRLSGYCTHEGNTYLVFEYAEKGSLDDWLFRQQKHQSVHFDDTLSQPVLGWKQRVQIACNIADALNYLHSYIQPPYIHKNLKTSNILLDSNFRAKITNFGLARTLKDQSESGVLHLTKHVVGTHGYLAPEYIENGAVTTKLDIFAFGVVMLELLSGKPAVKPPGTNKAGPDDLLFIVFRKVFEGENVREKLMEFMDSNLGREYPLDVAYTVAQLGYRCVHPDMNSRPPISEIAMTLSKILSSSLDWDPSDELANSSSMSHTR
ncbi:protein LYK5 [Beta vulgaris subsp. vulgaris]|uniref:protein LYK5 n=1 Tax=Beta vulgaris subsp. vulgaris TaxID=3555 RepID=UPI002036F10B|nr:protein LYK5 [Beta vulgaris subsp. vulgaris]